MSKNKKKKKGGYKPPAASPQDIVDSIVMIAGQIAEPDAPSSLWGELHKTFLKSDVDKSIAAKIIMHKDEEELQTVVAQLQKGSEVVLSISETVDVPELDHETQIEAMRCFRKRVKFMVLDRESKLGVGPLTSGKDASVDSMMAPHDYPMEVWLALAVDGQLVNDGGGFFHIPN
ncbi:MAG: hypothetical protein H8E86_02720 [Planctomycetes bacterium]|nr:hypothetical protein [Planctomycetota bacterium]